MKNSTKNTPQVKIVKRARQYKRSVFYIEVSNFNNDENAVLLKVFPHQDKGNSNKTALLN